MFYILEITLNGETVREEVVLTKHPVRYLELTNRDLKASMVKEDIEPTEVDYELLLYPLRPEARERFRRF